jgi:hypothetical protein
MANPLKVNWSFTSQIDGGPQLNASQPPLEITAYDYMKQTLAAEAGGTPSVTDVHLQPDTAAKMVAILADKYDAKVTYQVDGKGPDRILDGPHVFLGAGAVGFLSTLTPPENPQKLTFTNATTDAITVQVFVGRSA